MLILRGCSQVLRMHRMFVSNIQNDQALWRFSCVPAVQQSASYHIRKDILNIYDTDTEKPPRFSQQTKETLKSLGYLAIILGGGALLGHVLYTGYQDNYSTTGLHSTYDKAVQKCLENPEVTRVLGERIIVHGSRSEEGVYRRKLTYNKFRLNHILHMKMQIYLHGNKNHGRAVLEVKENDAGEFEFEYLYVIADDIARSVICLVDKRPNPVAGSILSSS